MQSLPYHKNQKPEDLQKALDDGKKGLENWRAWMPALNDGGSEMAIVKTFGVMVIVGILIFIGVVTIGGMAVYSKQSSFLCQL